MAQGDPNNSVIPVSGLDGKPLSPPGPWATPFDQAQYEKAVFNSQMVAQTRQDVKDMWRQRSMDKMKDLQGQRAAAEAAFESMVATCLNNGQVARLMGIKDEWITDCSTGPVRSYSEYMAIWSGRVG